MSTSQIFLCILLFFIGGIIGYSLCLVRLGKATKTILELENKLYWIEKSSIK